MDQGPRHVLGYVLDERAAACNVQHLQTATDCQQGNVPLDGTHDEVDLEWKPSKDHWGYVEHPFEEEYQRWQHYMQDEEEFDPALWFLAMDSEQIAGVSLCRPKVSDDPEMGWVSTLGVRRPWRRRGLGLALLQHTFAEFHRRGMRKVGLGVDAQNLTGALRLYYRAGMQPDPARQYSLFEKELRPGEDLRTKEVGAYAMGD